MPIAKDFDRRRESSAKWQSDSRFGQSLVASPRTGLDLPVKALAWEDADGTVRLSSNAPEYLEARHGLPHEAPANIAKAGALIARAAEP